MELVQIAIWGVLVFTTVGLIFGIALAGAARKFHVPMNPKIEQVQENLPAANCGACGYGACQAYAEHVVEEADVSPTLCIPGGQEIAISIGEITGKAVGEIKPVVASLRCSGSRSVATQQAEYVGIHSCAAAALSFGGAKSCKFGCLGLGDCVQACAFDAMAIGQTGIVEIDEVNCTGCGLCVDACPKLCLDMIPREHRVVLSCLTEDQGKVVKGFCTVGCIRCSKCIKKCPAQAISFVGEAIVVDHEPCIAYGPGCHEICIEVCPTEIIHLPDRLPLADVAKKARDLKAHEGMKEAG